MSSQPTRDAIGLGDLLTCHPGQTGNAADNELLAVTMELLELMRSNTALLRNSRPGYYEGPLICALVLLAGGIQGELNAMGMVPDITDAAVKEMLFTNWRAGVSAGRRKVAELAAAEGVDPTTGRPPE